MLDLNILWLELLTVLVTVGTATLGWIFRSLNIEVRGIRAMVQKTREEMAREYATKKEIKDDIDRLFIRLDAIDAKLDRYVERNNG